ncbi:MAG: UvrD-helicase domain-containing protein [Eubacterium sp.]|nr:UvrD-helicase domain-containing protein [Eubacterium sp.]
MTEKKWTAEQLQAITERGENILVSAGAGSGKTAVMVERATRLILEDRVPVSGMLIVTFTNAAASEMRERLRQALKDRLSEAIASGKHEEAGQETGGNGGGESEQEWIRKQLDDLHSAQISTFHSFAQRVIREFFYLTDLEPGARVLDEAEAEVLKEEALEELFDSEYEENSDDFRSFMDSYSGEKNDSDARWMILSLYRKLEAVPAGLDVLDEKIKELELGPDDFKKTRAYEELLKICRRDLDAALESAAAAEVLLRNEGLDRMADLILEDAALIRGIASSADKTPDGAERTCSIDSMAEAARTVRFARVAALKDEKEAFVFVKDTVKALRDEYKGRVKEILKLCYSDLGTMTRVMNMTVPHAKTLSRLIRRFDQLFRDIKSEHRGIDYSDMEHYAYEILGHKEAADYYRDLFRYIFIDEYQDTNYMQETIAGLISRGDNMFMVGDIKQSIYHFRLADPEIFQNKYDEYKKQGQAAGNGESGSVKIDLNMNFRSKEPVIREINNMFRPLMSGYDKDAELVCGVSSGDHVLPEPKTYIVDRTVPGPEETVTAQDADMTAETMGTSEAMGTSETKETSGGTKDLPEDAAGAELEDMKKEEIEARQAVQIIRENLGLEFSDPKTGQIRKVDYRDIVILMRSFRRSAEGYRKAFREAGIPLYIDDKDGYFDTIEINVALALLSVIDNKRQDVPFIALLRSEIFGFTCEELAMIRKLHRDGSYVEAAEAAAGITDGAGEAAARITDSAAEVPEKAAGGVREAAAGITDSAAKVPEKAAGGAGRENTLEVPEELRLKCRRVFDEIKKWQTYAVTLPLADMIWRILNETGYYVIAGTFPGGAGRQANLRLLADRARDYSEKTLGSLYGFIKYIDTLKKNQVEMPQATLFSENENVVRIMTIHHSKGLEFPVVILAGMDNQPKGGGSGEIDFDREIGLGLRAKDPVRHLREDSLVQRIIAAKEKIAETDELKRVFYVAVTRARETFYLLGAADYEKIMAGLDAGQHSDTTLLKMSRYLPEVVHISGAELISKSLAPVEGDAGESGVGQADTADRRRDVPAEEVISRLDYEYPYAAAGELAAKTSVTGLNQARIRAEENALDGSRAGSAGYTNTAQENISMRSAVITGPSEDSSDSGRLLKPVIPGMTDEFEESAAAPAAVIDRFSGIEPEFMQGSRKITAAETGTVYHKIMEKLDFSLASREGYAYIAGKAAELVNSGIFTEEEAKSVDLGKIADFFKTDIGIRCTAASKASMLYKEQPFESKIRISGEDMLVQGVIDCWFEEDGEAVLIDYKTNRIDRRKSLDEEKASICSMYRTQLDMYADAVEKAAGKHVKERYLYLFAIGEAVEI